MSIDAKEEFDKSQHLFMTKTQQTGNKENVLQCDIGHI